MEIFTAFLGGLGGAGVVVIAAGWFAKKYFERLMDVHFKSRDVRSSGLASIQVDLHRERVEATLRVLPVVQKAVTNFRNCLREVCQGKAVATGQIQLQAFANELADVLYASQLLLDGSTFDLLHRYKRLAEQASRASRTTASDSKHQELLQVLDQSEALHSEIRDRLRKLIMDFEGG